MNVSRTLYSGFQTQEKLLDSGRFVEAILLFDTVLLPGSSILPSLVKSLGVHGVLRLLEEGRLALAGGFPTAQGTYDYKSPGFFQNRPVDRPLRYGFETIYVDPNNPNNPSVEKRIANDLEDVDCDNEHRNELQGQLTSTIRIIDPNSLRTSDDLRSDIARNDNLLLRLFVTCMEKEIGSSVDINQIHISVHEVSDEVFEITTNLDRLLGLQADALHEFLKKPFFTITGTNLQLRRMRAVGAASGLLPPQARLIANRIDFTSNIHLQSDMRREFTRIREISRVPVLDEGAKIDIELLLKLRNSDEARAFRDWLHESPKLSDQEVEDLLGGWKERLGEALKTKNVKVLRWLASTGVGVAEPITGIGLNVLDQFLGRFLPGMGPIGFIVGDYRRFLKSQEEK